MSTVIVFGATRSVNKILVHIPFALFTKPSMSSQPTESRPIRIHTLLMKINMLAVTHPCLDPIEFRLSCIIIKRDGLLHKILRCCRVDITLRWAIIPQIIHKDMILVFRNAILAQLKGRCIHSLHRIMLIPHMTLVFCPVIIQHMETPKVSLLQITRFRISCEGKSQHGIRTVRVENTPMIDPISTVKPIDTYTKREREPSGNQQQENCHTDPHHMLGLNAHHPVPKLFFFIHTTKVVLFLVSVQISLSKNRPFINYLLFLRSFFTSHKCSSSSHSTSNTYLLSMVSADSGVPKEQESGNGLRHRHRSIDVQVWRRH